MRRLSLNILHFLLLLSLLGCAEETLYDNPNHGNNDKTARLTLNITLPNNELNRSGVKAVDDKSIENVYILGFRVDDQDETIEYFEFLTSVNTGIENIGNNKRKISFTANQASYKQRFVVIANSAGSVSSLNPGGQLKEDVLNALLYKNPENEWSSTLPMWGESDPRIINNQETALAVTLTRVVAGIDVIIEESLRSSFTLKEVYLYNAKTRGRIVPDNINWDSSAKKALKPSIPVDNDPENNPLTKVTPNLYEITNPASGSLLGAIYTFEAEALTEENRLQSTSLVIGGEYNGKMCYYRLDLSGKDENNNVFIRDILRNHKYIIRITDILGEGRPNPEEAFKAVPVELSAIVKDWDMAEVGVVMDEQYFLKVSDGLFKLTGDYTVVDLYAETDHPAGLVCHSNFPWISWTGGADGDLDRALTLTVAANNTGYPREGTLDIVAGNLNYVVHISQTTESWITVTQQPFYLMNGESHSLTVNTNRSWTVKVTGSEVWDEIYLTLSTHSKPDSGDESTVSFITFNDLERMISTGDFSPHEPVEVTLVFSDDNSESMKEVTVLLVSAGISEPSNSYLLQSVSEGEKPSTSHGIYIPLSMVNDPTRLSVTHDEIYKNETLDAELIWTDNQYILGEDAAISEIRLILYESNNGYLYVQPGRGEGNALIGLFPYNHMFGYYKWSWHIWVSKDKEKIEKGEWMDRNLGALMNTWSSETSTTDRVTGLYYQWGRKEPFTPFTKWTPDGEYKTTYPLLHNVTPQYAVRLPFEVAINQWNGMLQSPDTWKNDGSGKNVFDPCPVGWRLPTKDELSGYVADFNNGITGDAGYLPAGGRYKVESSLGLWEGIRTTGYYWVADGDQAGTAYNFFFDESGQYMTPSDTRHLSNIRCVRE